MKRPDPVLSLLSIAAKAGRVLSGTFAAERSVKQGRAGLVILASDASENTKKKFRDACAYRGISIYEYADSARLGGCIGKGDRVVVALEDEGFTAGLIKKLRAGDKAEALSEANL